MPHSNTAALLRLFAAEQRSRGLTDTTVRNRHTLLTYLAGERDIATLTTAEIREHIGRPGIKKSSRRADHAASTAFFGFLQAEGIRLDNPMSTIVAPRVPRGTPRPFTLEQIDRMLCSGIYWRRRVMILLGVYQGFRVSQIARVHGRDLNLEDNTIRTIAKGGKEGTLPLHAVIREVALLMPRDDWWFPSIGGRSGHIRPGSVTEAVADAKHAAGIFDDDLTAHSLRHTFGTELVEAGVDIRVIQELMMHEDLGTTQIYTGVSHRRKDQGIQQIPARVVPLRSARRTRDGSDLPNVA